MTRAQLMRVLKPLFGLGLLVLLATQIELSAMLALARRGDPRLLVLSLGAFVLALAGFQALRLHVLVRDYTGSLANSLRLFFVGAFFNNLLPSNVGGDAIRLLYLRNLGGGDWAAPLALLMLHRLSGIVGLFIAFAFYAPFQLGRLEAVLSRADWGRGSAGGRGPAILLGAALLVVVALAVALRSRRLSPLRKRVGAFAGRFGRALFQVSGTALLWLSLYTVLFHAVRMAGFYCAVRFFGETVGFWDLLPVLGITAVVALLPLTVGGLGLVEGSLSIGLSLFGVASEAAVGCAFVHRVGLLIVAFAGGFVYLGQRGALQAGKGASSPASAATPDAAGPVDTGAHGGGGADP